jgi:hypothetical protein
VIICSGRAFHYGWAVAKNIVRSLFGRSQYLHISAKYLPPESVKKYDVQDPPGRPDMWVREKSSGQRSETWTERLTMPRFRQLIPDDQLGVDGFVLLNPRFHAS